MLTQTGPGDPGSTDTGVTAKRPRDTGRASAGIAGASLIFGADKAHPDLVLAMQYLIDDLRAEGRTIGAIKLTGSTLRLRADPFEVILTRAASPLPAAAMQGLLRPPTGDQPDFARVHLARTLRLHSCAMGFLLRRRGAPIADLAEAARQLAAESRFLLHPVIEATAPALLVWQPGGLVLSAREFRAVPLATLLAPGDPQVPLIVTPPERLALTRPGGSAPMHEETTEMQPATPALRSERYADRSLGRFFGSTPKRPKVLPRIEREGERLAAALRDPDGPTTPKKRWFMPTGSARDGS
ncbi:hypothetical protein JI664_00865 [Rhodobacter sp. NTK016B]|uniref:hypothetical protein n=1 Tax=Rhodobacter sp. NTK016B TaxID=2759676 RepID=UPI001A908193|nr:hypothetical protein [Rhodobacter sp. NTK016B]MBN8290504.1 hypothetical protein [Rhodobacter sp. NTK016B]